MEMTNKKTKRKMKIINKQTKKTKMKQKQTNERS